MLEVEAQVEVVTENELHGGKKKEEPSTPPKIREERKRTVDEESKPGKKNPDAVKVPEKSKDGKSTPTVKPRERKKEMILRA